jgi:ubiquinone/menaquinone biosynthesis C-methylase UbiE
MSFMSKLLRQCRKPSGLFGRIVANGMNRSHASMTQWGLEKIPLSENMIALDIGCGGGGTVRKLARVMKDGKVYGIDYSPESVMISRKVNAKGIKSGRVDIRQGTVSSLPYGDDMFDLVTAVETHYFWPNLPSDLIEVLRVLKPGSNLVIIGGEYKGGKYDTRNAPWVQYGNMTYLTLEEHQELLEKVQFVGVTVFEDYSKGWLCVVGKKPLK